MAVFNYSLNMIYFGEKKDIEEMERILSKHFSGEICCEEILTDFNDEEVSYIYEKENRLLLNYYGRGSADGELKSFFKIFKKITFICFGTFFNSNYDITGACFFIANNKKSITNYHEKKWHVGNDCESFEEALEKKDEFLKIYFEDWFYDNDLSEKLKKVIFDNKEKSISFLYNITYFIKSGVINGWSDFDFYPEDLWNELDFCKTVYGLNKDVLEDKFSDGFVNEDIYKKLKTTKKKKKL